MTNYLVLKEFIFQCFVPWIRPSAIKQMSILLQSEKHRILKKHRHECSTKIFFLQNEKPLRQNHFKNLIGYCKYFLPGKKIKSVYM